MAFYCLGLGGANHPPGGVFDKIVNFDVKRQANVELQLNGMPFIGLSVHIVK